MRVFHPATPSMLSPPLRLVPLAEGASMMWTYAVIIAPAAWRYRALSKRRARGRGFGVAGVLLVRAWFASRGLVFAWDRVGQFAAGGPLCRTSEKGCPPDARPIKVAPSASLRREKA